MTRSVQALVNLHPFVRLTAVVAVVWYFLFSLGYSAWIGHVLRTLSLRPNIANLRLLTDIAGTVAALLAVIAIVLHLLMVISDATEKLTSSLKIFGFYVLCEAVRSGVLLGLGIGLHSLTLYGAHSGPTRWLVAIFHITAWLCVLAGGLCLLFRRGGAALYLSASIVLYALFAMTYVSPYSRAVASSGLWYRLETYLDTEKFQYALSTGIWPSLPPWPAWVVLMVSLVIVTLPASVQARVLPGQRWREVHIDDP